MHAATSAMIIIVKQQFLSIMIIYSLGVMHEHDNTILSPNIKLSSQYVIFFAKWFIATMIFLTVNSTSSRKEHANHEPRHIMAKMHELRRIVVLITYFMWWQYSFLLMMYHYVKVKHVFSTMYKLRGIWSRDSIICEWYKMLPAMVSRKGINIELSRQCSTWE